MIQTIRPDKRPRRRVRLRLMIRLRSGLTSFSRRPARRPIGLQLVFAFDRQTFDQFSSCSYYLIAEAFVTELRNLFTTMSAKEEHKNHKADSKEETSTQRIFVSFVFFFVLFVVNRFPQLRR